MLRMMVRLLLVASVGCNRTPNGDTATKDLVGTWTFQSGSGCKYGVASDVLEIRQDGSFVQRTVPLGSVDATLTQGRWAYSEPRGISLDKRFHVPAQGTVERRSEILVVEFSSPPIILLDPDSNCFYERSRR
jgi:hypothetical protein